ncbi:M48 family metallopeptidase [Flammeovirga kamogawensis]|uniref:M48 family metalloprotease n=1 Tax=Flammeovirga kamogawensis TaxID=373891 RepID=A0ABX8H3X5_9BACT|nr:M48 family metallopeptidase [Flammeovirga kamogawensis]MBB6463545.1 putative Zn-dependent protease [Flammeovirga kamogawensis]QWG10600.1 M48 family metalloprotease [Flammeovirga kamogawensis]TRX63705.1 M48 family metalloprotease [Flammeovirga kamogawensis]
MIINKTIVLSLVFLCFQFVANAQSIELDKMLGKENAKSVAAQMGIYNDKQKTEYIRKIGNRLVSQLDNKKFDYQFYIVPEETPNAFALPGGYIFITTGLLPIIESEDELACIMAHEIIHAHERHSIKQMKKSILPRLLEVPGNLVGVVNKNLGDILNAPIQTSNALLLSSYSRKHETEADVDGVKLATKAGYDPKALMSILDRMSKTIEKATGHAEVKSYFNDHPYTKDRISKIEEDIKGENIVVKQPISSNFLMEFDSLLYGQSPSQGVVRKNEFLHPDLDFRIKFPKEWNVENHETNVSAYNPSRNGVVFLTLDDAKLQPKEAAAKFLNNLKPEEKACLSNSEKITINGLDSFVLSFKETVNNENVTAYACWIPLNGNLFQLTGICPEKQANLLEEVAESLRVLTQEEKASFTVEIVTVVHPKKGENLKDLSNRYKNTLDLKLVESINDISSKKGKLKPTDEIKIVVEIPYVENKFSSSKSLK